MALVEVRRAPEPPPPPPLPPRAVYAAARRRRRCYYRLRPPPLPSPTPLQLTTSLDYRRRYIRDFYWPLAAAGLVLTVAILWWEGEVLHFGAWATFLTVVMYTANLWGVLMFIFLMSHALVRPPPPPLSPLPPPLSHRLRRHRATGRTAQAIVASVAGRPAAQARVQPGG